MSTADDRSTDSVDGQIERAKDSALGAHRTPASHGDEFGEATGGIAGVLVGAGIGSAAGPVGTLLGGIAGALGGWWMGRAVSEAAESLTQSDEAYFRAHYNHQPKRYADRTYEDVRGAYYLGQIASHNPNFAARAFSTVAPELERGWTPYAARYGDWNTVRQYAAAGYAHGRARFEDAAGRATADQEARTPGEVDKRRI